MKYILVCFLILIAIFQNGCTLFFGNIKPVDEKSNSYAVMDLSENQSVWTRLDHQAASEAPSDGTSSSDPTGSDLAYQSKNTAAIISVNTACKGYGEGERKRTLEELSHD